MKDIPSVIDNTSNGVLVPTIKIIIKYIRLNPILGNRRLVVTKMINK